jgi:Ca2+-binding RTX toxin-like protein
MDGADSIEGFGVSGTLIDGDDNDTIKGGDGNDSILGGEDNDMLFGDNGNDVVSGGSENDQLYDGMGNDLLLPGADADSVYLSEGNDTVTGPATDLHNDQINDMSLFDLVEVMGLGAGATVTIDQTNRGNDAMVHIDANNDGVVDSSISINNHESGYSLASRVDAGGNLEIYIDRETRNSTLMQGMTHCWRLCWTVQRVTTSSTAMAVPTTSRAVPVRM